MPIFSAFAATVASAGLWTALTTTTLGQLLMGVAFNAISSALLRPDIEEPGVPGREIIQQLQQGANVPRSFIVGRYATKGSLVYHNSWNYPGESDDGLEFYTRITALSDVPVKGLVEVWVDDRRCTIDWNNPVHEGGALRGYPLLEYVDISTTSKKVLADGRLRLQDEQVTRFRGLINFYDGTQTTADQHTIAHASSAERPWTSSCIGYGVAYAVFSAKIDAEGEYYSGVPDITYVVDGMDLYDPHSNTTGVHNNINAVQIYNILKGVSWNGQWLYGPQHPIYLDPSEWAQQISLCKQPVPGASGWFDHNKIDAFGSTTVPAKYRSGMEITVDTPIVDTLSDLLASSNGRIAEIAGRLRMQVGDPQGSSFSFTDSDIIITEAQDFNPFLPLAETVNSFTANYPEPREKWKTQEAPPLIIPSYEVEDGNRRLASRVQLKAVPYPEQTQRLMKGALAEARRARKHVHVMDPRYWVLEPGDYGDWTSNRNYGGDPKQFRVDSVTPLPNTNVRVEFTEVDPADYSWEEVDYNPVFTGSIEPVPAPTRQMPALSVSPHIIVDSTGLSRRPGILVQWTSHSETVRHVLYQVILAANSVNVTAGRFDDYQSDAGIIDSPNLLPAEDYLVRVRLIPGGAWSSWFPVTTDDVRLGYGDLTQQIASDIQDAFDAADAAGEVLAQYGSELIPRAVLENGKWYLRYYTLEGDPVPGNIVLHGDVALADDSVTAPKIFVTSLSALSANLGSIMVDTANIQNAAIVSAKIQNLEIGTGKLAFNSVTSWQDWTSGSTTLSFGGMTAQYMAFALARFGTGTNNTINCEITLNGVRQAFSELPGPGNITVSAMFQLVNGTNNIDVDVNGGVLHNFSAMIVKR